MLGRKETMDWRRTGKYDGGGHGCGPGHSAAAHRVLNVGRLEPLPIRPAHPLAALRHVRQRGVFREAQETHLWKRGRGRWWKASSQRATLWMQSGGANTSAAGTAVV